MATKTTANNAVGLKNRLTQTGRGNVFSWFRTLLAGNSPRTRNGHVNHDRIAYEIQKAQARIHNMYLWK